MKDQYVHKLFERVAKQLPDQPAIEEEHSTISYCQLNERVNALSHVLYDLETTGKIVNVLIPTSSRLVTSMLAIFKTNAIYLPMDLGFSTRRFQQIFTRTFDGIVIVAQDCLLYTSPSPRDLSTSRMPSSA